MQLMDRVPEGEGIEPMLTVLETHIYQVLKLRRKQKGVYILKKIQNMHFWRVINSASWFIGKRMDLKGEGGGMIQMHNLYTPA